MAFLIPLMGRATDETLTLVTDAVAYFYEEGTLTPLTVYTDETLATPRGTTVAADAEGVFPQCWVDVAQIKVDVKDGEGVSLPGFPQDDFPTIPLGGQTASATSATPVTGNAGTTVQAQLDNNTGRINRLDSAAAVSVSGGTGGAYTLTSAYTITAYAARQEYEFVANMASVGGGADSLNVDSVGAVVIKKYVSGSKADLAAGDIAVDQVVRVKHDGTHFVLVSAIPLDVLDEDDFATDSATLPPSQQSVAAYIASQRYTSTGQTISTAGLLTLAHGLGAVPRHVTLWVVCTDAGGDAGYAQNDKVMVTVVSSSSAASRFNSVYVDSTNVYVRFSDQTNAFIVANKSTGVAGALTDAKWQLYVEASLI